MRLREPCLLNPPFLLARAGAVGTGGEECVHEGGDGGTAHVECAEDERGGDTRALELGAHARDEARGVRQAQDGVSLAPTRGGCTLPGGVAPLLLALAEWALGSAAAAAAAAGYGRLWVRVLPKMSVPGSDGTGERASQGLALDGVDVVSLWARENAARQGDTIPAITTVLLDDHRNEFHRESMHGGGHKEATFGSLAAAEEVGIGPADSLLDSLKNKRLSGPRRSRDDAAALNSFGTKSPSPQKNSKRT
ncbi:hypothetical protein DFH09DRAFT_1286468 [Mycena vulgaris]|nr:hypothetical protein DFH09DRAFT_1286468 [Mycena vulgaris]